VNRRCFALVALILFAVLPTRAVFADPPAVVFAAASLKPAMDELAGDFEQATGHQISLSYGGSSALARQIQYGAPAQIFLSANAAWMDLLQDENLLVQSTRTDLLTNRLVLIATQEFEVSLKVEPGMDLAGALGDDRLALALVDAVPAGIYAQAALKSLGVWPSVQSRIAQTDNVSAALRLVAIGEAPLGIVYATDTATDPRVKVLGEFPENSHPPILYPVARLAEGDTDAARAFFDYLISAQARVVFQSHGFGTLTGDES
jgi:molybdate transport system substrate-binding protein